MQFRQTAMIPVCVDVYNMGNNTGGGSGGSGGSSGGGTGGTGGGEEWIGDGNTHIWISLTEGRTSPMLGVCPNGTVTVDWGDGTEPDILTGTSVSTVKWTPTHNYANAGDYIITLIVDGSMNFYGTMSMNEGSSLLRYTSGAHNLNYVYRNSIRYVEIGNGVTKVGDYAFSNCYNLSEIVIPEGVTSIGEYAFQRCYSLSDVVLPKGVRTIGRSAFNYCYNLSNVVISDGIITIDIAAFQDCYCLINVVIPEGLVTLSGGAFQNCYSLSHIVIPNSTIELGANAFMNCYSLSHIVVPSKITTIQTYTFSGCYAVKLFDFTRHTSVPVLGVTSAFNNISTDCEIRVPAALVDEWKAATNWSTYADYIVGV